jgi:integrase
MRRQGYRDSTCYYAVRTLKRLDRRANILEPEAAKRFLADCNSNEGGKQRITEDVDRFYRYKGIKWERPRYENVDLLPHVPKEEDVNTLIAGLSSPLGTFCLLLKETGCRSGEAWHSEGTQIDMDRNAIVIRPEKGSRSRELRISNQLIARLNLLPKNRKYVFHDGTKPPIEGLKDFTRAFQKQRSKLAMRLANPKLQLISFRSLRHYKGTMEYHRTRDIVHVQRILGHRSISNTLRYVRLISFSDDEFVSKVAKTVKEAQELVEAGFDYVCDVEGYKVFRKRKCRLNA